VSAWIEMRTRAVGDFRCGACGGGAGRVSRVQDGWQVVRCADCGLLATWPAPDDAILEAIYESDEYLATRSTREADLVAWSGRLDEILAAFPPTARPILDFGAGPGHLVNAARHWGVPMEGIEPSRRARELARELYGIELRPSLPRPGRVAVGAITALHVLEHVRDPVADLRRLRSLIAPGGVIFIEVPHAGAVDMRIPSRRRLILDLPAHLHHFTPATLAAVVTRAGWRVLDVRLFNSSYVEALLALRSGRARQESEPFNEAAGENPPDGVFRSQARALWGRVLAGGRKTFPGPKFQMLASAD
jgi:SAM-dependent methyltransferase